MREERVDRHGMAQLAHALHQPQGQQRMPAQREEAVAAAYALHGQIQQFGPGLGQRGFQRPGRRFAGRACSIALPPLGGGSARRSILPLTLSGSAASTATAAGCM